MNAVNVLIKMRKYLLHIIFIFLTINAQGQDSSEVEQWRFFELKWDVSISGNPYENVSLSAVFEKGNDSIQVKGFYNGSGSFLVRFSPPSTGEWKYKTESNIKELDQKSGRFMCFPAMEGNHGTVQVKDVFSFSYADGTDFHPFGTTLYAWTHQSDSLRNITLNTLSQQEFNKVRMCVFPKDYWWNHNEPEIYPFEGNPSEGFDFKNFNAEFFQDLEEAILQLDRLGIEVDLILFHPYDRWGFSEMGEKVNRSYVKYVISRLSAFKNIWWSLANEYDFMEDFDPEEWDELIDLVEQEDPYGRLRSIHNGTSFYDHSNPKVTHASIQSMDLSEIENWRSQYQKPIIIDECGYEGDIPWEWGNLSPESMVSAFWEGIVKGAYMSHGETYLTNIDENKKIEENDDVLWWSKGGTLQGESPERISFLKDFIEDGSGSKNNNDRDYLIYFGSRQPALHLLPLENDRKYEVYVIDTRNMTIDKKDKIYSGHSVVELPGQSYIPLRIVEQ